MKIDKIDRKSGEYPELLKGIKDPPELLYCIGDLGLLNAPMVAIVGTRRSSPYGRWAAFEIARRVSDCQVGVISGMAEGIDSAAHKGCLAGASKTVAVLGTGIDICFPKSNEKLYKEIKEKGLVISEYPPGFYGKAYNFPRRNRIISGMSQKVVVVEGAYKSGSMITAALALEQGRDVFAVPGNINQPNSVGVNKLIADGAFPIIELENVTEVLGIAVYRCQRALEEGKLTVEEQLIIKTVFEAPGCSRDYVCLKTGINTETAAYIISALELNDLIRVDGSALFVN